MITVGIATLAEREEQFKQVIASIYPQCDRIVAVLNDYTSVPEWTKAFPNMEVIVSDNRWGASAKFYGDKGLTEGFYFSIDDDLLYPPTYVSDTLSKIKKHRCIVSYHGKRYDRRPIQNWRKDITANVRCLGNLGRDLQIHIPGTGVMAYDTSYFSLSMSDFPSKNMADISVGKKAFEQRKCIMALAHRSDYFHYLKPSGSTIWSQGQYDIIKTRELRSFLK